MDIEFAFPLPRVHTGIHLANGRMGALVWGDRTLKVTVAHAGFWDHRGGRPFGTPMTYAELRRLLLSDQEERVREAFQDESGSPYQIGGGRIELDFGEVFPTSATLSLTSGRLVVRMSDGSEVEIFQSMEANRLYVVLPPRLRETARERVLPSWDWTYADLERRGVEAPKVWSEPGCAGFRQSLPADPSLTVELIARPYGYAVSVELGEALAESAEPSDLAHDRNSITAYWAAFWDRIPVLPAVPEDLVQPLRYAIWKLGCLTAPGGVPATLQGPWMEEHRIPLWSNDYHFNINLQMIYWPCLHLGLGDHLRPLWNMVKAWMPQLFANGERFFGVPGAAMLPHAVDDECHPIGSFWQGTIDHASTAWTAQLAWLDYARHGDRWVLDEIAWPLLNGAFEGYFAMLEDDGERLRLPISVSPEFGEGALGTWGANASFQLAAVHMLCQVLPKAAGAKGEPPDERWIDVARRLPRHSLCEVPLGPYDNPADSSRFRIGLWEGQDLSESHRHHSHLAGLYPFDSLTDREAEPLRHALERWADLGGGGWSAWGTAWAVCLMARAGWTQGARAWLRLLVEAARNEGGSLSAGGARGCFISWGSADVARRHAHEGDHEVMQLDANMGLITAIFEAYAA
ncbi:hypothetical protein BH11ARM2_BH11ARM2_23260 [soil metagenome]